MVTDLDVTHINVEVTSFVWHLNDANPRDATYSQTAFVYDKTTRTDANRRRLPIVILHSHYHNYQQRDVEFLLDSGFK